MQEDRLIVVNASAAKTGGAETILRGFIKSIPQATPYRYIILSPIRLKDDREHIKYIYKRTSGAYSIWFSIFGIVFYILKYRPDKVLSFNNLNYILSPRLGITYFHQSKVLDSEDSSLKVNVYRFFINYFLKKNIFIVQSDFIRSKLINHFSLTEKQVISCWPGFTIPDNISKSTTITNGMNRYLGLLPIAYASKHKNVELLNQLTKYFDDNRIHIVTLLPPESDVFEDDSSISCVGPVSRSKLFGYYNEGDFVIFTSKVETIGLPIFEFLQTGKPVFAYQAEYIVELYKQFDKPENLVIFRDLDHFKELFPKNIGKRTQPFDYSRGEWSKMFDII